MRALAWLVAPALLLAGCISSDDVAPAAVTDEIVVLPGAIVAHGPAGIARELPADIPMMLASNLDFAGGEPTLGVTSDGYVFYVAYEKVLRSADGGATWDVVSTPLSSPTTLDPYIYVDADTGRVYSDQLYLGCSYLSWSDDHGDSWLTNPAACGLPVNDHQKIVTAKPRGPVPATAYEKTFYYAYNAIAGSRVAISYDGGVTFPVTSHSVLPTSDACNGGLHGNIIADAEGILYIPKRNCDGFILAKSDDGGLTWSNQLVGADAGGSECRKNADLATDVAGNVYGVWPGKDNHMYLSSSQDQGTTWLETSLDISPAHVNMTTMPAVVAGDAGRIAVVYYGTADGARGPDEVEKTAMWHLYATYSLNALDAEPTFVTLQVTEDPVQVGGVSTNSDCEAPEGSRNLLDFLDAQLNPEGRVFVAYTDGCIEECADKPAMKSSRADQASFAVLQSGPSLFASVGSLSTPFMGAADHEHGGALTLPRLG